MTVFTLDLVSKETVLRYVRLTARVSYVLK